MGNSSSSQASSPSRHEDESPLTRQQRATFDYLSIEYSKTTHLPHPNSLNSAHVNLHVVDKHLNVKNSTLPSKYVNELQSKLFDESTISLAEYLHIGSEIAELNPGCAAFTDYYIESLYANKSNLSRNDIREILQNLFTLSCFTSHVDKIKSLEADSSSFTNVVDSIFSRDDNTVSKSSFVSWCQRHCSLLFIPLHSWLLERWSTPGQYKLQDISSTSALLDSVTNGHSLMTMETLWLLSASLPSLYSSPESSSRRLMNGFFHWIPLYDSNSHGLSLNRFDHHVFGYKGASITLIEFEDHVYVITSGEEWKDSTERWGGVHCFMIQVKPQFKIIQSGASMFYLNLTSRNVPKGFQFGKDRRSVMLEINEDMTEVKQYGIGQKLGRFECWGCGGMTVRHEQLAQKQWEQGEVEKHKNRKLKLETADWKDSPDRLLLEMGGIQVSHAHEHPNE